MGRMTVSVGPGFFAGKHLFWIRQSLRCDEPFERRRAVAAGFGRQAQLAHMGNVEQAGPGTGMKVFVQYAGGVLHRHVVAGEGHHLGAQLDMEGMERCAFENFFGHGTLRRGYRCAVEFSLAAPLAAPPLSSNLKD